jgi:hypothetical protein
MDFSSDVPPAERAPAEAAARLQWLLRLRWVVIPMFVAVDVASDLLLGRRAWTSLLAGAALVALNGAPPAPISRDLPLPEDPWTSP